jgi:YidC/Oxa1 family membrane protein insertase
VTDRRFLLAVLLSVAILIAWQFLFPPPPAPPPDRMAEEPVAAPSPAPAAPAETEAAAQAPGTAAGPAPPELAVAVSAAAEERVTVETGEFRATFTNRGAQLLSFELLEHREGGGGPVDLVRSRHSPPHPFALVGAGGEPLGLNQALFAVERGRSAEGHPEVIFRYGGPEGQGKKRFTFLPNGLFEVEIEARTIPGTEGWGVLLGPGVRNPTLEEMDSQFERRAGVYRVGGEVEVLTPGDAEGTVAVPGPGLAWAGLEDTYFLTALVPRTPVERAVFAPVLIELAEDGSRFHPLPAEGELTEEQEELKRDLLLLLYPRGDRLLVASYWGGKNLERLASLPHGLEETIGLGVFGFLSQPLLVGLRWIHDHLVPNYGWAIILMTVLIKLLLFPLTHKSYVSMQKMQEVNPKVQAIRAKYRGKLKDKQGRPNLELQRKMNEEVMGLYKSEGVNPAGGCLPMLLQIPVLFAFYRLLTTVIELRGAPWMLWIDDLSAHDPYYILPIVMGGTQYLQQRLTPMAGDPMQRRIFQLMPVIFTVWFLGLPSGLVLYWLTNNVLTIAQQQLYKSFKERRAAAAAAAETAPAGKRSRKAG